MAKQRTVREVFKRFKEEGFIKSPSHTGGGSHSKWIHKDDPSRFAIISFHNSGQTIPIGTLKSIEKSSGVIF
ncbi:type II toxin-antitoxin system HicA family toxin [Paenibacillus amylolyticus]|uniref:type II toxin-antitoxin system HicA family toxin n=1 Tax=Paenibacillus amylolyticus TaxID=1451 RepID=UPI003390A097